MKIKMPLNLSLYIAFVLMMGVLSYIININDKESFSKPWHMQMNAKGDSLSEIYLKEYQVIDHGRVIAQLDSFAGTTVLVLVDAWGVPYEEKRLAAEFAEFESIPHKFFLHKRLMSYTKFAEQAELRTNINDAVYFFNGDSLEYNRSVYIRELGYKQINFCQMCNAQLVIAKVDSLLLLDNCPKQVALSLQSSREGDDIVLKNSLKQITTLAQKYSGIRFVVQGTHRPVLVSRKFRETFYQYWVPVVVLN